MTTCDTSQWKPSKDSRIWIFTIEAEDCQNTPSTCVHNGSPHVRVRKGDSNAQYVTFRTAAQLEARLREFLEFQNAASQRCRDCDSIILQLSTHGSDFQTMSFGGMVADIQGCLDILDHNLTCRTILMLNQCWGGWPKWARLFRKADCSPRFILGSVKRYGTAVDGLNRAEAVVFDWLEGRNTDEFPAVARVVKHIHETVARDYPNHEEFYRVWFWEEGLKKAFPEACGKHRGVPDVERYRWSIGEYTLHIYIEQADGEDAITKARHRGIPLGGPYSAAQHSPHTPRGQYHLHVFLHCNEIFAINRDGTAHDRSHGTVIPGRVADALRAQFPQYQIPENRFIKSVLFAPG